MVFSRNTDSLYLRRWGTDSNAILRPPEADGLTRTTGLPTSWGVDDFISLGVFNQWLAEVTAVLKDAERTGILPWKGYIDSAVLNEFNAGRGIDYLEGELVRGSNNKAYVCKDGTDNLLNDPVQNTNESHWELLFNRLTVYQQGGIVLGSDGTIYRCKQTTNSNTQDPVKDTANTVWEPLIKTLDAATTRVQGAVQLATISESVAGLSTERAVTLEGVNAAVVDRVSRLAADGVINGAELVGTTLQLTRTQDLDRIDVDLAPLISSFAPTRNAVLTGSVNVPEPGANEDSSILATTAFVRRVGPARFAQRASATQTGISKAANATELSAGTATGVFVDLAGLETRLAQIVGPRGTEGPQGRSVTGTRGDAGPQGGKGPQGLPGNSIRGVKGDPGDDAASVRGPKGLVGPVGDSIRGPKGLTGPDGNSIPGPKGLAGPSGTSIQGPRGNVGPQGEPGLKGFTGSQGNTGARGNTGANGNTRIIRYSLSTFKRVILSGQENTNWVNSNFALQSGDIIFGFGQPRAESRLDYRTNNFVIFLINLSDLGTSTGSSAKYVWRSLSRGGGRSPYQQSSPSYGRTYDGKILGLANVSGTLRYWAYRPCTFHVLRGVVTNI